MNIFKFLHEYESKQMCVYGEKQKEKRGEIQSNRIPFHSITSLTYVTQQLSPAPEKPH